MLNILKKMLFISLPFILLIYFLCATTLGLRSIFYGVSFFVPGKLTVNQIHGKLISTIYLEKLTLQLPEQTIALDSLVMKWSAIKLLKSVFLIKQLEINNLIINFSENKHTTQNNNVAFDPNQLAWLAKITLRQLQLNKVLITQNKNILFDAEKLEIKQRQPNHYTILLTSSQGTIEGQYQLYWQPTLAWKALLNVNQFNLSRWLKTRDTSIHFTLISDGTWSNLDKSILFNITNLQGNLDKYTIKGQANFYYQNGKIRISNTELSVADAFAKLAGSIDEQWNINWQVSVPALQTILPDAKGKILSQGKISGTQDNFNIIAQLNVEQLSIADIGMDKLNLNVKSTLSSQLTNALLTVKKLTIYGYEIPLLQVNTISKVTKENLLSQVVITSNQRNSARGDIRLENIKHINENTLIKGGLSVSLNELTQFITIPEVSQIQGNLRGNINLSGTLYHPLFLMHATINQGQLFIPKLKVHVKDIQLSGNYQSTHPIQFTGTLKSGEGDGKIAGTFKPEEKDMPVALTFEGKNLQVINLPEYKAHVSPQLSIYYSNRETSIKGDLLDVSAHITPKRF